MKDKQGYKINEGDIVRMENVKQMQNSYRGVEKFTGLNGKFGIVVESGQNKEMFANVFFGFEYIYQIHAFLISSR